VSETATAPAAQSAQEAPVLALPTELTEQEQVQPPPGQLGLNPVNQWNSDPTPTAAPDRSVPDAPVVGGLPREEPPGEDGPQAAARRAGAAWPPLLTASPSAPRDQKGSRESARK
jgi:hypothetical protein